MEAYQERVIQEKKELDEKIAKLEKFLEGNVHDTQVTLMAVQYQLMLSYSMVLEERIKTF